MSGLLADAIVVLHFAFVLFVGLGGLLVVRWPRIAWAHLPAAAWGIAVESLGWFCPLTSLEDQFRAAAGRATHDGGFIGRWLLPVIYPEGLTRDAQIALAAAVLLVNVAIYAIAGARARSPRFAAARYLWALPNTLVGLLFVPAAMLPGGRVRIVAGVLEMHGPALRALLGYGMPLRGGVLAITFGHVVIARDGATLEWTRQHERVHVRQCELWGPAFIPAYLAASLWAALNGSGAYHGNYFERAASREAGS